MYKINEKIFNQLLSDVKKPARYSGRELNQIKKNNPFIRMAVCYPDLYEIGMSNNGIKILYDIANSLEDVSCERVFAVAPDFEKKIRAINFSLYTLETYTPLHELDLIGFNIAYELLYTNILQILDLGHIPIFSENREENHPIIIGGGECVSNPLPLCDFFDAFFIGDGEEGIIEILNTIRKSKTKSLKREYTIEELSKIEGIFIPKKYNFQANEHKQNRYIIKKRIAGVDAFHAPLHPVIPNMSITQEKFIVEVTRGCKNLCNYCHAGYYDLPYRYNKPDKLRDQILALISNPYFNELTLSSLSISDYNHLIDLLNLVLPELIEKGISISLPSLKVDKNTISIIKQISDLRKTSLTFAVESGCDEIRNMANKKINTQDILAIAEHIFANGWNHLKLYFMIGLPGCEEYDEAESIIKLLKDLQAISGRKRELNVTISPFVPKPHTPFQNAKQMNIEYFSDTIKKIKKAIPRNISVKAHDVYASILEGVMSRGDRELNSIIYNSYKDGCRLDSWKEYFNFKIWEKHLNAIHDWHKYLRERNETILPWDFISTGFERLVKLQTNKISEIPKKIKVKSNYKELNSHAIGESMRRFTKKYNINKRIRLKLSKRDKAKYISHLDFIGIIIRGLRLSNIPISFTQGFNKRERISMGYPLPIGIESVCELCDIDLYDDVDINAIIPALSSKLPEGIDAVNAVYLDNKISLMSITSAALYNIDIDDISLLNNCIKNLKTKIDFIKYHGDDKKSVKFDDCIIDYSIGDSEGNNIKIKTRVGNDNSLRIDNIMLSLTEANYDELYKFKIIKLCQYRKDQNDELTEI